ncbi:MAG: glycoside hydrolase family 5 protein [Lachnospiraceae bacterium]|nr:glycoside hydrolase family 5 protein [Lachnospiraceae bacterium]
MEGYSLKRMTGFEKGVNLAGWFSQCDELSKEHIQNYILDEDLERIAGWGCDHVRLPIDHSLFVDKNGNFKDSGFEYAAWAIERCRSKNLNAVIDLNKVDGFAFDLDEIHRGFFDSILLQEKFYELWERIAQKFGKFPQNVAFELLSDITDDKYSSVWNNIIRHSVSRIRYYAPFTIIIFGGCRYNSCTTVYALPNISDKFIAYTFHFNAPLLFTHQGAHWMSQMPLDFRYSYEHTYGEYIEKTMEIFGTRTGFNDFSRDPDSIIDEHYFEDRIEQAIAVASDRNKFLYCGEYGVIKNAKAEEALKWYKAVNSAFSKYNIARAAWCYKGMDFGISDQEYAPVIDELVKYL